MVDWGPMPLAPARPVPSLPSPATDAAVERLLARNRGDDGDGEDSGGGGGGGFWSNLVSIPGQGLDLLGDIKTGITKLPGLVAHEATHSPISPLNYARLALEPTVTNVETGQQSSPWSREIGRWSNAAQMVTRGDPAEAIQEMGSPLLAGAVLSAGDTAGRVRHPSRYADAFNDQNFVSVLSEDLSNLSLVGGAAKVAVAPRAAAAKAAASEAGQATKRAGNAAREAAKRSEAAAKFADAAEAAARRSPSAGRSAAALRARDAARRAASEADDLFRQRDAALDAEAVAKRAADRLATAEKVASKTKRLGAPDAGEQSYLTKAAGKLVVKPTFGGIERVGRSMKQAGAAKMLREGIDYTADKPTVYRVGRAVEKVGAIPKRYALRKEMVENVIDPQRGQEARMAQVAHESLRAAQDAFGVKGTDAVAQMAKRTNGIATRILKAEQEGVVAFEQIAKVVDDPAIDAAEREMIRRRALDDFARRLASDEAEPTRQLVREYEIAVDKAWRSWRGEIPDWTAKMEAAWEALAPWREMEAANFAAGFGDRNRFVSGQGWRTLLDDDLARRHSWQTGDRPNEQFVEEAVAPRRAAVEKAEKRLGDAAKKLEAAEGRRVWTDEMLRNPATVFKTALARARQAAYTLLDPETLIATADDKLVKIGEQLASGKLTTERALAKVADRLAELRHVDPADAPGPLGEALARMHADGTVGAAPPIPRTRLDPVRRVGEAVGEGRADARHAAKAASQADALADEELRRAALIDRPDGKMGGKAERALSKAETAAARADAAEARLPRIEAGRTLREDDAMASIAGATGRKVGTESRLQERAWKAAVELGQAERKLRKETEKYQRQLAKALDDPRNAPSRWRPAIQAAEDIRAVTQSILEDGTLNLSPAARTQLAGINADINTTLLSMVDEGNVAPVYMQRGTPQADVLGERGGQGAKAERLGRQRETGTTAERSSTLQSARSFDSSMELAMQRIGQQVENEAVRRTAELFGKSPDEVLRAAAGRLGLTDEMIDNAVEFGGDRLAEYMDRAGYRGWHPDRGGIAQATDVTAKGTIWIPEHLAKTFESYRAASTTGKIAKGVDMLSKPWRYSVLQLSPRWHVNNLIGNAIISTLGGIDPWERGSIKRQARLLRDAGQPAEVLRRGMTGFEMVDEIRTLDAVENGVKAWLKHPIKKSSEMNAAVDDLNRTMLYVKYRQKGLSEAEMGRLRKNPWAKGLDDDTLVHEYAVRQSLKFVGDFTKLTQFERNVMRRIMPFYPWYKHITKLAFRLPLEHPARLAWTMHLAEFFAGEAADGQDEFSMLNQMVGVGDDGTFYRAPAGFDPFRDVPGLLGLQYTRGPDGKMRLNGDMTTLAGGVNPVFPGVARLFGVDLRQGGPVSRPFGENALDEFGNEMPVPRGSMFDWSGTLRWLTDTNPLFQIGRDTIPAVWGSTPIVRHPTGEPRLVDRDGRKVTVPSVETPWGDTADRWYSTFDPVLQWAGFGRVQQFDLDKMRGQRDDKIDRARAARKNRAEALSK